MKVKELLKKKKIKVLINEIQLRALAQKLNEQEKQTIMKTHLIKL
jgi:hypothetical protein